MLLFAEEYRGNRNGPAVVKTHQTVRSRLRREINFQFARNIIRPRNGRWGELADSRYRAIIRLPGLLGTSAFDVLFCHQSFSPTSLPFPRFPPYSLYLFLSLSFSLRSLLFRTRCARGFFHIATDSRAKRGRKLNRPYASPWRLRYFSGYSAAT
ncbi:hypothetical protein PUN28_016777 [Cardiocondyla obscurior]|uniref:Uncharacterized protein n=1 Tax=Cardiocondyla obscurior TaxID=286306 RepID=A0AAW2EU20_9HYME